MYYLIAPLLNHQLFFNSLLITINSGKLSKMFNDNKLLPPTADWSVNTIPTPVREPVVFLVSQQQ